MFSLQRKVQFIIIIILISIINLVVTITANAKLRTSYKEVGKIRDVSIQREFTSIKRIIAHIVIPLGRSEEEVRATLEKASKEIGKREQAIATTIKAYRPQDDFRSGVWTAGRAIYAPNGKWEDALIKAPLLVTVEISKDSLYFKKETDTIKSKKKQGILLTSKNNKPINISSKRDSWVEEDIIAKIPAGTPVSVIQRHEEALTPEMLFVRCQVRLNWKGKNIEGWVHGYNIKENK